MIRVVLATIFAIFRKVWRIFKQAISDVATPQALLGSALIGFGLALALGFLGKGGILVSAVVVCIFTIFVQTVLASVLFSAYTILTVFAWFLNRKLTNTVTEKVVVATHNEAVKAETIKSTKVDDIVKAACADPTIVPIPHLRFGKSQHQDNSKHNPGAEDNKGSANSAFQQAMLAL